jgi:RNA polymerase sigma-70 factor (ECF subfamily)
MKPMEAKILDLLPLLRRYSRSLSDSIPDAEDLLQDSLAAALASQGSWRGRNLKSWLMTIMTNQNRNRRRRIRNAPGFTNMEYADKIAAENPQSDPLERDRLQAAINLLSDENRSVLMLVVVEGYSYTEVADILSIPLGTVMSRLSRARKKVADTLEGKNIVALRKPK